MSNRTNCHGHIPITWGGDNMYVEWNGHLYLREETDNEIILTNASTLNQKMKVTVHFPKNKEETAKAEEQFIKNGRKLIRKLIEKHVKEQV